MANWFFVLKCFCNKNKQNAIQKTQNQDSDHVWVLKEMDRMRKEYRGSIYQAGW